MGRNQFDTGSKRAWGKNRTTSEVSVNEGGEKTAACGGREKREGKRRGGGRGAAKEKKSGPLSPEI